MRLLPKFLKHLARSLYQKSEISSVFTEKKTRNNLILRLLLVVFIVFFLILTFDYFKNLTVLLFFIILNAVFAYLKTKLPFSIRKHSYGFELVLLCTVVSSVALGSRIGMTMGIILMITNYLAEKRPSDFFIVTLSLYAGIGYYSYFFKDIGIVNLGIVAALLYNFFAFIFSKFFGGRTSSLIIFNTINILFNVAMFNLYAEFFLNLLI